jgi:hypothetical protein
MSLFTILMPETIKLYRYHKNIELLDDTEKTLKRFSSVILSYPKKSTSLTKRNLLASIGKQLRAKHPYIPYDCSEARNLYYDYFKMENHIPSYEHLQNQVKNGESVFLVKFRTECPMKHHSSYSEYYINGDYCSYDLPSVLKAESFYESSNYNYVETHRANPRHYSKSITPTCLTCYRYATESEIKEYEITSEKYQKLQSEIDKKNKEIDELQKKWNKI